MQSLILASGILGNVFSFMTLAAPMPTFWRIVKKRSTESFSAHPYIATLFSNMLWLYYGLLKPNATLLVVVGGAACAFEAVYLTLYLCFGSKVQRVTVTRLLVLVIILFTITFVFTVRLAHGFLRLTIVGIICAATSVCMYAAPLTITGRVIRTKSVEYMPVLLSLFIFLCGATWSAYAIFTRDLYVGVPNVMGFVLGSIQLSLYACYRNPKMSISNAKNGVQSLEDLDSQTFVQGANENGATKYSYTIHDSQGKTCCDLPV